MLEQKEQTAVYTADEPATLPLPTLLSLKTSTQPPPALLEDLGFTLASFIHNYHQGGTIYRYFDFYDNKVKTVLSGVEANMFAMRYAKTHMSVRKYRHKQMEELGSDKYLVAMDGDAHYQMRKLQKPGYARSVLEHSAEALAETVQQALANHPAGEPLPAYNFFQNVGTIQLGKTIFNHDSTDVSEHLCAHIDGMLEASFVPKEMPEERAAAYKASMAKSLSFADEMIAGHAATPAKCPRPDIVDGILTAVSREEIHLTQQELRIAVLTPYIAGINPVAHTCSCLLYALLTNPHIMEAVVAEVKACVAEDGFSLKSIRKMELLRYSILEALRLYPFAPVLELTAVQEFGFHGHRVKEGTAVILAITVPHFLEKHYKDPFTFDIERYTPERGEHRLPGAFVPYGVGSHICLGAGYAEDQMMLSMAALLHSATFTLDADAPKPKVGLLRGNSFTVHINTA